MEAVAGRQPVSVVVVAARQWEGGRWGREGRGEEDWTGDGQTLVKIGEWWGVVGVWGSWVGSLSGLSATPSRDPEREK